MINLHPDLTPYLDDLSPDPQAYGEARAHACKMYPAPLQSVPNVIMCLTHFYNDRAAPDLPAGLSEAVGVLSYAASGLFGLLELDYKAEDPEDLRRLTEWQTLGAARSWVEEKLKEAGEGVTPQDVQDLKAALITGWQGEGMYYGFDYPHLLKAWIQQAREAGREREAARFGIWAVIAQILLEAHTLVDGAAEDLTEAYLEALAP